MPRLDHCCYTRQNPRAWRCLEPVHQRHASKVNKVFTYCIRQVIESFYFNRQVIQAMNFTPEQMKPLQNCNLVKLKERLQAKEENGDETPAKMIKLDEDAIPQIEMGSLDGLVIACRRPSTIAKELIKLLAPSGSFVIYCPYSEVISLNLKLLHFFTNEETNSNCISSIKPLSDTYIQFRECNLAVNLKLTEAWFRSYQVLPARTHPEVMMSGSGGYTLSGIKVVA